MDALRQTYRFIEAYHHRLGIFPTQREIGKAFGISPEGVSHRLRRMKEMGWITTDGRRQSMVLRGLPDEGREGRRP